MARGYSYKFQKVKPVILFIWRYRCYLCKRKAPDLHVHHVNYQPFDNGAHNLIPLCKSCHKQVHNVLELEMIKFPNDVAENLYILDELWKDFS